MSAIACFLLACALASDGDAKATDTPIFDELTIVAPSVEGGGWDLTAQAMKVTLEAEGIVRSVEVIRSPGAGGLIGLAQFSASRRGDVHSLLVGGLFMLGAAQRNGADVSMLDTTPIARLTHDFEVIAVPKSSPYRTLDDLLEAMRVDVAGIRWAGGSAGGPDQLVVWQLAHALGLQTGSLHYTPFSGGSRVAAQLAEERFAAGVSGFSEFAAGMANGSLRALGISSKERMPGVSIPTFEEQGVAGLSFSNWRGVFAPPDITEAERIVVAELIRRMVETATWREMLERFHWESAYLTANDFSSFIMAEEQRIAKSDPFAGGALDAQLLPSAQMRRLTWMLILGTGIVLLTLIIWRQKSANQRRETALNRAIEQMSHDAEQREREIAERARAMEDKLAGMSTQIEREFERWGLTSAERSVAHLMLKGLRLKDIARARNTSDRTVRQQAQAIYKKAGIDGRSDLAAYFMEDFLAPAPSMPPVPPAGDELIRRKRATVAVAPAPAEPTPIPVAKA